MGCGGGGGEMSDAAAVAAAWDGRGDGNLLCLMCAEIEQREEA